MAVVRIGKMQMAMGQFLMPVRMAVPGAGRNRNIVCVLMMRIVRVLMCVLQHFMRVFVLVAFAQVQPNAEQHQRCRNQQRHG